MKSRFALVSGALALSALSQAVILTPGAWTALPGSGSIPGIVIQDVLRSFSFSAYGGTVSGTVQNRVVRKGDGTLYFAWRVFNDPNSAGAIQDLRLGNFVVPIYDSDWTNDSPGSINPTRAFLFSGPGGFVNFNFQNDAGGGGLTPDDSSRIFYIDSQATQYAETAIYDLTNLGQTQNSDAYSTFGPVPEPATTIALGMGALALLLRRRQRK